MENVLAWEAINGRIPAGAFVALRTDMHKDFETNPEYFKRFPFPAWTLETIQFIYTERGALANGHEAMDTDTSADLAAQTWLHHNGHFKIEVMANLDQVPQTGALIVVSWPKPKDGDGFPARAFAIIP